MTTLDDLPIRDDLRGSVPYGAPQLDVPVQLNVNENSHPVPPQVVEAIESSLGAVLRDLNRYPDREFTALRAALAGYLDGVLERQSDRGSAPAEARQHIAPEQIWAANGSNEVLAHILQAFGGPGRTALGFTPSYSMHPLITASTGAAWVEAPRVAGFDIDIDTAVAAVREHRPDVVFLCTPNNPTGNGLGLEVVEAVLAATDGIVIVDEAYAEFARPGFRTALGLLPDHPRLVVSRTMSKAFAFAGVRLGYAVAHPALVDALRLVRLPYHLSALTQAAACAALAHAPALLANVDRLVAERDRMSEALRALGFSVVPSDSNFLLFGGIAEPHALWQDLLDRGVLIRDIGIPGHLRVNAGTVEETDAFVAAVRGCLADRPAHLAVAHDDSTTPARAKDHDSA
ncbi:histidinol-phosphate transaminase [Brevibacterium ihuae]|uniref:histidinol-phosphate transaminase n=1 Tax=Brevibacterium ihuae TaxID=1631743 RepID=UPI000C766C59|nr:histidinol-phosphate transaminase [Brevibacterium ihuae]